MGAMAAAAGITSPARVRLTDLVATDGMPSENYKHAVAALSQSLRNFNAAIIQVPHADDVLLRCVLDSVRMFFHKKTAILQGASDSASEAAASAAAAAAGAGIIGAEDPQSWNRTAGYYAEPQHARETYDFRPGRMIHNEAGAAAAAASSVSSELPPAGLPEVFAVLGSASRTILDAIGSSLDLRSYWWTDLLDNVPLKAGEISTSVLSTCCQNRPGAHQSATTLAGEQAAALPIYEEEVDKGLLTLLKSDKPGLQIRDLQGRWMVVDADLGPQDMVLFTGLSLYQTTGGYLSPSLHRTDINTNLGQQAAQSSMPYGRCTVAFKLMPRASAILHCAAMSAAGHHLGGPFQQPVPVHEFMQRSHPTDQLVMSRPGVPTFSFSAPVEAAAVYQLPAATTQLKATMKRKKQVSRGKPLAPSKRLRLEAQRVLKERVQEIADNKGLKIRYCNLKECEEQHLNAMDSPCAAMRAEMEWPAGVPFVHPHDLPNKAKQAFLEAYEPGWTAAQDGDIQMIDQSGQAQQGQMLALTGAPHVEDQRFTVKMAVMEDQRFAVKTVYDFLRTKGKPVPTGKPQVVGHKVDISGLAKAAFEAGGRAQFEADAGFQRFIATHFQLDTAPERDKERALERLKKLYDQVLADYVEELVASSTQQVS